MSPALSTAPASIRSSAEGETIGSLSVELSVVMPCLNEADTVAICVHKAVNALRQLGIRGEVVIADNGSTDGSQALAESAGARVVAIPDRGYGSALMGGIEAARGQWVIMGDADDSYDFNDLERFVVALKAGCDLAQGCRLPGGGGTVLPGAMPFLHRWWGNPMFTLLARWWFHSPVHDIYCGLRGFRKSWWQGLGQRCTGMEFATEMLIKASLTRAKIVEVPITLHPDGRKAHAPHLKTFRDGWRTLRFFLICTPKWLFLIPGLVCVGLGTLGYCLSLPGTKVLGVILDVHTLLCSSLAILCGWQAIVFAICTKTFAIKAGFLPRDTKLDRFFRIINLERGLGIACLMLICGLGLIGWTLNEWRIGGFGFLDYPRTMRLVVPGATLTALGFQTILASFLVGILGTDRR